MLELTAASPDRIHNRSIVSAMGILRVVNIAPARSLLPNDSSVNVWHFLISGGDPTVEDAAQAVGQLQAFYADISSLFSPAVAVTADSWTMKAYKVTPGGPGEADDVSGSPILVDTYHPGATGASALPEEVALCLSYRGNITDVPEEQGATRPAARRRGRIYLGPLATSVGTTDATSQRLIPTSAAISTVLTAADTLQTALQADVSNPMSWAVYSRANGVAYEADLAWISNDWDTQRRRGRPATARTTQVLG